MKTIKKLWDEHPLALVMIAALFFRIIAVIFAKGYGMSDDHFMVLEWARHMLDGVETNTSRPAGHSIVYPWLHYLILFSFKKIGLYKPELIMYVVRFLHAALSLLTVYFSYKIVLLRKNKIVAGEAGLLVAILWLFPFMSVRNLIEVVCIPFIMIATYFLLKYENKKQLVLPLISGLFLGIAFIFRYQTNLFAAGFVAVLLFRRDILAAIFVSSGFLLSTFLIQGLTDWAVYGYPYASFISYYLDNSSHAYSYTTGEWYVYIFTIMGILIPPTSLLIMFGFLHQWKRWALVFWPTFLFLAFHSAFPNKQERFILPAIPLFIVAGIVGWREFVSQSEFWKKHSKLHVNLWRWFWIVNAVLLLVVSTTYSKKTRVEVMSYFGAIKDVSAILIETSDREIPPLPTFYMGKDVPMYFMTKNSNIDSLRESFTMGAAPDYLVMMNHKHMEERSQRLNQLFPDRKKLAEISPSLIDQLLYFLNPRHNVNQRCIIYKLN